MGMDRIMNQASRPIRFVAPATITLRGGEDLIQAYHGGGLRNLTASDQHLRSTKEIHVPDRNLEAT